MKTFLTLGMIATIFLASCQSTLHNDVDAMTSQWKTYVYEDTGFSMKYPADWRVQHATAAEQDTVDMIATFSEPDAAEWSQTITLYDRGFVDPASWDDVEKSNYPAYRQRSDSTFEYDGRTDPPTHILHVNHPNNVDGVDVVVTVTSGAQWKERMEPLIQTIFATAHFE